MSVNTLEKKNIQESKSSKILLFKKLVSLKIDDEKAKSIKSKKEILTCKNMLQQN